MFLWLSGNIVAYHFTDLDTTVQDFVPVQHMGYNEFPFQKHATAQDPVADDSFLSNQELHLANCPAQLSSPFSSSEAAYTNTFAPSDIKSDQVSRDSSDYEDHPDYDQHDLSVEANSSLDGAHFAEYGEQDAEVSSQTMS